MAQASDGEPEILSRWHQIDAIKRCAPELADKPGWDPASLKHARSGSLFSGILSSIMSEVLLITASAAVMLVTMAFLVIRVGILSTMVRELLAQQTRLLEDKHRDMLKDLHEGLVNQGDRLSESLGRTS